MWTFNNTQPIYLQIVDKIKDGITTGTYPPNSQLPPVRQLAQDISVNPNTVQRAMNELEEEGLVFTQGTLGRFIVDKPEIGKDLGKKRAEILTRDYLSGMNKLGLTSVQAIDYITSISKEEAHEQ